MQLVIVIFIVVACAGWLGWQGFLYFKPRAGGKACAGGCCDGGEEKPPTQAASGGKRTMMISSDDLRARVAARKA
jgi:hypothetical protein